ncbi:hypothetical protein CEUSTIGMA_g11281.t1 [Chlamydomonas eustigma]|uniref:Protein kinase domain-containing protein n=1 Tax=Chlamydomonas eustigma TaxID=1157962 RepID=A0A250XLE4_9CHLO|nr:hypothetical protein CEUSTIGMA_g11281.t1 [Chlamydomonas eustigma]|eukprot:GAX83856.1 hypothetical protein CEUSTIGMA_g11281.t1 [Chlamydomonas eustigma]
MSDIEALQAQEAGLQWELEAVLGEALQHSFAYKTKKDELWRMGSQMRLSLGDLYDTEGMSARPLNHTSSHHSVSISELHSIKSLGSQRPDPQTSGAERAGSAPQTSAQGVNLQQQEASEHAGRSIISLSAEDSNAREHAVLQGHLGHQEQSAGVSVVDQLLKHTLVPPLLYAAAPRGLNVSTGTLTPDLLELPRMPSDISGYPQADSDIGAGGGEDRDVPGISASRQAILRSLLGFKDDGSSLLPILEAGDFDLRSSFLLESTLDSLTESKSSGHSHAKSHRQRPALAHNDVPSVLLAAVHHSGRGVPPSPFVESFLANRAAGLPPLGPSRLASVSTNSPLRDSPSMLHRNHNNTSPVSSVSNLATGIPITSSASHNDQEHSVGATGLMGLNVGFKFPDQGMVTALQGLQLRVDSCMSQGEWGSRGWALGPRQPSISLRAPPDMQRIPADDLEKVFELGRGCHGKVWLAKWRGVDVALKELINGGLPSPDTLLCMDPFDEAQMLASLRHPCIVTLYGIVVEPGCCAMAVEFMRMGSLKSGLKQLKCEGLDNVRIKASIALQAARGMEYLHSQQVVHFDLKSDNFLCDLRDPLSPIVKIGDLGLSQKKKESYIQGNMRGTIAFMAPELFYGATSDGGQNYQEDQVTEKVDVYSFGICLWEIWSMCSEQPYKGISASEVFAGVLSKTLRPVIPESMNPEWRCIMEKCWDLVPAQRPSFTEVADSLSALVHRCRSEHRDPYSRAVSVSLRDESPVYTSPV